MEIYTKVTKRNSQKYFQDFLIRKNISLNWLYNFLESKGIDRNKLDFSPKSLIIIWKSIYNEIEMIKPIPKYKEQEDKLPLWFYIHSRSLYREDFGGYTIKSLQIIESLVYYFGEVFIKEINLKWEVFREPKPKSIHTNMPVIMLNNDTPLYPFEQITTFAIGAWQKEKLIDEELYSFYNYLIN